MASVAAATPFSRDRGSRTPAPTSATLTPTLPAARPRESAATLTITASAWTAWTSGSRCLEPRRYQFLYLKDSEINTLLNKENEAPTLFTFIAFVLCSLTDSFHFFIHLDNNSFSR